MDKKKIIILVTTVLLIVGLLSVILFYRKSEKIPTVPTDTNQPAFPEFPIIQGTKPDVSTDKFEIKTQEGPIHVNNVYKLPPVQELSYDGIKFKNSDYYSMDYYPNQQGFIIIITNPDIEKARQIAEDDFLNILGISKNEACQLNVSMTVFREVSDLASGRNYRLSFCPNGKPFPKDND